VFCKLLVTAAAAAACLSFTAPGLAQNLPVEAFTAAPGMQAPTLSPSGNRIAFISVQGDRPILQVVDFSTGEARAVGMGDLRFQQLQWASEGVVVLRMTTVSDVQGTATGIDRGLAIAVDVDDGMSYRTIGGREGSRSGSRLRSRIVNVDGDVIGVDRDSGHVIMNSFEGQGHISEMTENLYSVDPRTGDMTRLQRGSNRVYFWILDENSELIAQANYFQLQNRQELIAYDGDRPETISVEENSTGLAYTPWGLLPDGRLGVTTLFRSPQGDTRRSLYAISLSSGEFEDVIISSDRFDLNGAVVDPYTNGVVGAHYDDFESSRIAWIDAELETAETQLWEILGSPSHRPELISWSMDRATMLARYHDGVSAPMYVRFLPGTGQAELIGVERDALNGVRLPERSPFQYQARDGEIIHGFITRPEGDGPHPAVILPHGGPASHDAGGFDQWAHFLATRGYVVLQPNFRGSRGFGRYWLEAGYGEWGTGVMQHDVTDAAIALVEAGETTEDRLCIVGHSYGGYAALAGAAFTPDLFQCAVASAPVTNLASMIGWTRERFGRAHWLSAYWAESFGDETSIDYDALRAVSPSEAVDNIHIPVLILHGSDDTRVPISQSETMVRALRRADRDVTYVELDGGDHDLSRAEDRLATFQAIEAFLDEHIGGE